MPLDTLSFETTVVSENRIQIPAKIAQSLGYQPREKVTLTAGTQDSSVYINVFPGEDKDKGAVRSLSGVKVGEKEYAQLVIPIAFVRMFGLAGKELSWYVKQNHAVIEVPQ